MRKQNTSKKYIDKISQFKSKCSYCGHTTVMLKQKFIICGWCGHKIYKNKQEEFKDKIKKELKKH